MNRTPCRRLGLSRAPSSASKSISPLTVRTEEVTVTPRRAPSSSSLPNSYTHVGCSSPSDSNISRSCMQPLIRGVSQDSNHLGTVDELTENSGRCNSEVTSPDVMASCAQGIKRKSALMSDEGSEDCDAVKDCSSNVGMSEHFLPKQPKLSVSVTPPTVEDLSSLRKRVALKEKKVKELRLAELYRKKHNPEKLSQAVQQWRNGCQDALQEVMHLLNARGQSLSMLQLLSQLGIPPDLVQYNEEEQDFD